jgi:pimeloyl-ACP methyl ester carboxylesterase
VTSDVLSRPAPPPDLVIRYGDLPEHVADVRLPPPPAGGAPAVRSPGSAAPAVRSPGGAAGAGPRPAPLVVFLHGGFWRVAFDRAHTGPLASALAAAGFAVCVPEFRRTGQRGGGWPGTFWDVATAVDMLPALVREAAGAQLVSDEPALLAGHSAGGHLALWAASRHLLPAGLGWPVPSGQVRGVVALAAVSDMLACHALRLGQGAARALLGGGPGRHPDRYRLADPTQLLPAGCPVRLVHGSADDRVPCGMSRAYAARARAAGDDTELDELTGAGHFDVIDPLSPWWPRVAAAFTGLAPP